MPQKCCKMFVLSNPNKYRSDLSKKIVFDPTGQRASKIEALKVSSDRESNPDRPKTTFSLLERFKHGNAPTSFFQFFLTANFEGRQFCSPLARCLRHKISFENPINISLEPEAQGPSMSFKGLNLGSK